MPDRATPRRADARRNHTRILDAATRVLAARGLAIPMSELAREAGVGVGTLYRHFPTKDALCQAILLNRVRELIAFARTRLDAPDPGEAFRETFVHIVDTTAADKALHETLRETVTVDEGLSTMLESESLDVHQRLLERAQHAGAIRPDITALDFPALISGCVCLTHHSADPGRMFEIFYDGLRPRPEYSPPAP